MKHRASVCHLSPLSTVLCHPISVGPSYITFSYSFLIGEKNNNASILINLLNISEHELGKNIGVPSKFVLAIQENLAYHFPFHVTFQIFLTCQFPTRHLVPRYVVLCIQMWHFTAAPAVLFLQEHRSSCYI